MVLRKREGALTRAEKQIVKALLADGWRNQDIQALVNTGRDATINSARITGVKQDNKTKPASASNVEFYIVKKRSYDPQTGLNFYDDERLIRAREAMILAVQVFNSPSLKFKTEIFAVLANIAWTYLLHEFYDRKKVPIVGEDGRSLLLSKMLTREDCPLSDGMKRNLDAIKMIRDDVEHLLLRKSDLKWLPLYQACCLNFEKALCDFFGDRISLQHDLSFALQFAKLGVDQLSQLHKYDIPEHVEALDARLRDGLTEEQMADLDYQFRVIFTLDSSSKSQAHMQFFLPDSDEAKEFRNVLVKLKPADELYPYKPMQVVAAVAKKTGQAFTSRNHIQAWRLFKARPKTDAAQPENTNKEYCIYHAAHGDYTYSAKWVSLLVEQVKNQEDFAKIKAVQI